MRTSGLPEDVVMNTFDFFTSGATVTVAQAQEVAGKVRDFYVAAPSGVQSVAENLSPVISRAALAHVIQVYDKAAPQPRQPVATLEFTIPVGQGTALPSEVALVLSLRASIAVGGQPARFRGRTYVGPLTSTALGTVNAGDLRPSQVTRTAILEAGRRMLAGPADLVAWSVFSAVDNDLRRITRLVMDDSFDTQRRRGAKPTLRQEASILPGPT
jgi:hypothetical protein